MQPRHGGNKAVKGLKDHERTAKVMRTAISTGSALTAARTRGKRIFVMPAFGNGTRRAVPSANRVSGSTTSPSAAVGLRSTNAQAIASKVAPAPSTKPRLGPSATSTVAAAYPATAIAKASAVAARAESPATAATAASPKH